MLSSSLSGDGRPRKTKQPHIRKGPGLPQLLAAFPDPPNNLLIATSAQSSPQLSPSSPLQRILPSIGKPPTGPLPDIPRSASSTNSNFNSYFSLSKERDQMSVDAASRSRSPSPDLSTIISSSSVRKTKSRPRSHNRDAKEGTDGDVRADSGNESTGSESSLDIHTPLP